MLRFITPPFLGLASAILLGATASAQIQQVCFTDSFPLTNTNWNGNMTVSKFDTALGTLQSIDFTLGGSIEGTAKDESTDNGPTVVTLNFQATLTLTRPDLSVIVVTVPLANFNDSLGPFDGTIDFAGPSGMSHTVPPTGASNMATSPPPASDLVLFSGPPGSPGNISLPISGVGSSFASGSGNVITSFTTRASATCTVCYKYLPNTPPTFGPPTPTCGSTLMASAGVPVSFQVCAGDTNGADVVTLTGLLPAGATTTPVLPAVGNPVCVTVNWTPTVGQLGTSSFAFTATDNHARFANCKINVLVAECYQFLARGGGQSTIVLGGTAYNSQLANIRLIYPVTMVDRPSLKIPNLTGVSGTFNMETVMSNAFVFPNNPDQWSNRLQVTVHPGQFVTGQLYGTFNGIHQSIATFTDPQGERYMTFPFTIDGM